MFPFDDVIMTKVVYRNMIASRKILFLLRQDLLTRTPARARRRAYDTWCPFQYPIRRLIVRFREISKPRDWYFGLSHRFEIWSYNPKYKSRGFETLRDLKKKASYRILKQAPGHIILIYTMISRRRHIGNICKLHNKTHTLHFISPKYHVLYSEADKHWQPMNIDPGICQDFSDSPESSIKWKSPYMVGG